MGFVCFNVDLQKAAEPHLFQKFLMNTRIQVLTCKTPMFMWGFVWLFWDWVFFPILEKNHLIKFLPYRLMYCFGLQWGRSSTLPRVGPYKGHSTPTTIAKVLK